jgi:hypothetical protein
LTIASVIGREFNLEHLSPLIEDLSENRLLEVLEEALAARVIEELTQSVGRYQFTHALIQETLAEELSTTRKVRLHARIAETLEELYGEDAEGHSAELAYHFNEAQTVLGTDRLVRYSLLAGERAVAAFAWEEAQTHFQRGLAAKGIPLNGSEPAADKESAELLAGFGRTRAATGLQLELPEAISILARALDYFIEVGDVERAVALAEVPVFSLATLDTGIATLISRVLSLVAADSHAAGRLLARYGNVLGLEIGDYSGAQRAIESALAIAQREQDTGLEMRILADAARVERYNLRFDEMLRKAQRALDLSVGSDALRVQVMAEGEITLALYCTGDLEGAHRHAVALLNLAERFRDRLYLLAALHYNTIICLSMGEWQAARNFGERGSAESADDYRFLERLAVLDHELGNIDLGNQRLDAFTAAVGAIPPGANVQYTSNVNLIPYIARITGDAGRMPIAEKAAEAVLSDPALAPMQASLVRIGLGLMIVDRRDSKAAADVYEFLDQNQPGMAISGIMCFHRVLGLLSQTMGNHDQAASHFEDSLTFCRAGYRVELAWTCCDYSDLLRDRNADGDRARAMSLLDESLAISSELGMRPLMERVLSRREILKA